jgi:hypothetical protein
MATGIDVPDGRGTALADRAERIVGVGALVSFFRHIQVNLPRCTTASGFVLLWGVAATAAYRVVAAATSWIPPGASSPPHVPVYLQVYLGLVAGGCLVASVAMVVVPSPAATRAGWALGSVVCAAAMAMYFVGRTAGLPGVPQWVGRWDYPLGTFAVALQGTFLLLHLGVLTGRAIAVPDRRGWHD